MTIDTVEMDIPRFLQAAMDRTINDDVSRADLSLEEKVFMLLIFACENYLQEDDSEIFRAYTEVKYPNLYAEAMRES